MLSAMGARSYPKGEVVFHEGDPASVMHFVTSGLAQVSVHTEAGDTVAVDVVGRGAVFGELALIEDDAERAATVTALQPLQTLTLTRQRFGVIRNRHPQVDRALIRLLAARLRQTDQRLLEALYSPVPQRVARRLTELCRLCTTEPGEPVLIPVTQETLAGMVGATRTSTNQALRRLEALRLVELARGRVTVLDPTRLERRGAARRA